MARDFLADCSPYYLIHSRDPARAVSLPAAARHPEGVQEQEFAVRAKDLADELLLRADLLDAKDQECRELAKLMRRAVKASTPTAARSASVPTPSGNTSTKGALPAADVQAEDVSLTPYLIPQEDSLSVQGEKPTL